MSKENPYQPPTTELQNETNPTSSGRMINTRIRDNLIQAGIIGVTMVLVVVLGALFYGVVGILSGAFLGMVAGLLISGTYLLVAGRK